MIFDDHDIRDDWNTSADWKKEIEATSWWHGGIVFGLSSYWVYQHLGNLSPAERAEDEIWKQVASHQGEDELDLTETLDGFADRVDQRPDSYRWSFSRNLADVRLVVVDSRAARVLEPGSRSILDDKELSWLDDQMQGGFRHLLVGTSAPFLLSPGLHHLEAWNEALVDGAWGEAGARFGEKLRRVVDLEHWAAFQDGFPRSRIVQAVCSPICNPLPRYMRFATAFLSYGLAGPLGAVMARSAKVLISPGRPLSRVSRWRQRLSLVRAGRSRRPR